MTNLVHFINIIRALKSVTIPGSLAQLGERLHGMEEVESSSLLRSTRLKLTGRIDPFFCAFFYIIGNMEKFRWCFIGVGGLSNRVAKQLLPSGRSVSEIVGRCQSLMCFRNNKNIVTVETPSKQVKEYFRLLHTDVPAHIDLGKFTSTVMTAKM